MKSMINGIKLCAIALLAALFFVGCDEDDAVLPEVKANYTFTVDNTTGAVSFINTSENGDSFAWNFGNGDEENNIPASTSTDINPVQIFQSGTYQVTLVATNVSGATDTFVSSVTVDLPNNPPMIVLLGDAEITLSVGDTFTDPGVTATDEEEGDLTANVTVGGDMVDTQTAGTYTITYNVTDSEGLAAQEVTRTVIVQEEGPMAAAPTPTPEAANVISIFSDAYTNVNVTNFGAFGVVPISEELFTGDNVLVYQDLNFSGIEFESTDISNMTNFTFDIWVADTNTASVGIVNGGTDGSITTSREDATGTANAGTWTTIDIAISDLVASPNGEPALPESAMNIDQLVPVLATQANAYIDNVYFYNANPGGGGTGNESPYCDTLIRHFPFTTETISDALLTVESVDRADGLPALKFTIKTEPSNNKVPDLILVNTLSESEGGGGNGLEAMDTSVAGQVSIEAFWPSGAPANNETTFQVLWSFEGDDGNWQLFETPSTTISLDVECTGSGGGGGGTTNTLEGSWTIDDTPGSAGVGPSVGDVSFFDLTTQAAERACFFDDVYTFGTDGSFSIDYGTETFLEGWQSGVDNACGTPIAPHDNSIPATFTYDDTTNTLVLNGMGAFIGLPKVTNAGELPAVSEPGARTFTVTFDDADNITVSINDSVNSVVWTYKMTRS